VKKLTILAAVTLLLAGVVTDVFAGDVEKALVNDLTECSRIIKQISGSRSGSPTADDSARLKKSAETLHADRLLLGERYGTITERAATLGGKAADRQETASSTLLTTLDELLSRLDVFDVSVTSSNLDALKQLIDILVPHKPRPLLGALPYRHTNYPPREPATSPVVKPAYKGGDRSVSQVDTASTPEASISKEIVDLAQSLQWNPVLIYEWVKNNVETEWYWGSMKGGEETLRQKSGNDADQAALLVALLRASGFPARFIKGTIEFFPDIDKARNLTGLDDPVKMYTFLQKAGIPVKPVISGGKIDNFQIEHIWVEAFIPYSNYRGAVIDDQGKIWLGLDTSIKPQGFTRTPGAGAPTDILSTFRVDYLNAVHTLSPLDYLKEKLNNSLSTSQPPKSWSDLKDSSVLIPDVLKIIPSSLQFFHIAITGEYQILPDELKHKVAFSAVAGGNDLFTITLDAHKLSNRKIALRAEPETVEDQNLIDSFGGLDNTPAYLAKLRPMLTIDGEQIIVAQDGLPMGDNFTLNIDVITPNGTERVTSSHITGNLSVIGVVAQKTQTPAAITDEDDAEEILHKEAIGYIDRWNRAEDDLASLLRQSVSRPTVTIATVGGQLEVTQLMGIPHDVQWKGLFLDAGYRRIETIGHTGFERDFMRLSALQGSILENRIFEDDLKVDSVSTAKLLQMAAIGDTPQITIDKTNLDAILPTLGFDGSVKQDITDAVNQGLTVTISQNEIVFQDWSGVGYVKENLETGESGWMLSGQVAGGMTAVARAQWIRQDLADLLTLPYTARANKDITQASRALRIGDYQSGTAGKALIKPLMAQVVDSANRPVKGIPVTFRVIVGGGTLEGLSKSGKIITQSGNLATVATGSDGIARARLTLGRSTADAPLYVTGSPNTTQIGQNLVSFSADTGQSVIQGDKAFESFGYPGDAVAVIKVAENATDNQTGSMGTFSGTAWVQVVDEYGNPVSNKSVTFSLGVVQYLGMTPPPDSGAVGAKLISGAAACPGVPTLSCGATKNTVIAATGYNGATAGIILGNVENASYSIIAQSTRDLNGRNTSNTITTTFSHKTTTLPRNGDAMVTPYLNTIALCQFDDRGNKIDVGAAGQPFGTPLLTELIYVEEAYNVAIKPNCSVGCYYLKGTGVFKQAKATKGSVTFSPVMGNGAVYPSTVINTDNSIYKTAFTLGTAPSLNVVTATGEYQASIPVIDSMTGAEFLTATILTSTTSFSIWGIGLSLDTTSPVYIDKNGYPETDTYFPFQISPSGYTTRFVDMRIYENQNYLGLVAANPGNQLILSQGGAKLDLAKSYTADVVLNLGSGIEVRSLTVPLNVTTLALIPDYDHNRKIDSKDRQRAFKRDTYYFWVNDDDGNGDTEGSGIPGSGNRVDHHETVGGTRDLVDWFPVNLDIANLLAKFDPSSFSYKLKHEDGCLDFVPTGLDAAHSGNYLTGSNGGIEPALSLGASTTYPLTAQGHVMSIYLLQDIKNGKTVIMVEAWKKTTQPLVLVVSNSDGKTVFTTSLNLSIDGVEQMFRHKNLIRYVKGGDGPLPDHNSNTGGEPDRFLATNDQPSNYPDSETNKDVNLVALHGYNVDGQEARGFQSEMFKRLYWSGSRAKFWAISWYGAETKKYLANKFTLDYHTNVVNAFDTAPLLKDFLNNVKGDVTIMAHSLGNMVASSMLSDSYQSWDDNYSASHPMPKVKNYFMVDAAVAIEAYDGEATKSLDMIHKDWVNYKQSLWPSEWHQLFANDDPPDNRAKLTWRGRFKDRPANTTYYNFYSSGEEVLGTLPFNTPITQIIVDEAQQLGVYAWAVQEKLKGSNPIPIDLIGSSMGGWGFNPDDEEYYLTKLDVYGYVLPVPIPASDANLIDENVLKTRPFFKKGPDPDLYWPGITGSTYAANNKNQLLADAVPALTLPVGGNFTSIFGPANTNNFDMQSRFKNDNKEWPLLRGKDKNWFHSDLKNVSYPFVYNLFDAFVSLGGLK
jgi:hypothetical protein